jgi:VanZ family protein
MPMNLRKALVFWAPIFVYLSLIFVLSSLSRLPFQLPAVPGLDKLIHFCEYGLLAALVARAVHSLPRPKAAWIVWLIAVGVVLVFGALDEWYQSSIPRRQSDLLDFSADVLGGMAGSLVYLMMARRKRRKRSLAASLVPADSSQPGSTGNPGSDPAG